MRARVVWFEAIVAIGVAFGVAFALTPGSARAGEYERLGRLERESVDEALASRGLRIDPKPEGKRVGRVLVVTQEVFAKRDGFLRWFNFFHIKTYPPIVERELLVRPGDPWNQARVDESRRNLVDPFLANVIVLLPVVSADAGQVDLLVVLRDVWSLRLNTNFEVQDGVLTQLSMSLSENNLFGLRKKLALAFRLDQGVYELGPVYIDPNVRGTRMTLEAGARAIFSRETDELEGSRSAIELAYPLWALDREWGASVAVSHYDARIRYFRGEDLLTYDVPETTTVEEQLPITYDYTRLSASSGVIRGFGDTIEHRVSFGHELGLSLPSLRADFVGTPLERDAFVRDIFPRRELASALFVGYRLFTPTFVGYRDLDTFDLREDVRIGPSLEVRVSRAMTEIGSDVDFTRLASEASWAVPIGSGVARAATGWSARVQDGRIFDHLLVAGGYLATPRMFRLLRLHASAQGSFLIEESNNRFFTLGGDSGLRGYAIGAFAGEMKLEGHVELRTRPLPVLFTRLGAVAFWDVGHAFDRWRADPGDPDDEPLVLHHDVGGGLRFLIPQLDPYVMRFDWALPLTGPTKGLPGRFTLGFYQVF